MGKLAEGGVELSHRAVASGCGIGLRSQHFGEFLQRLPAVAFVEVISENHMVAGGPERTVLQRVRQHCPVALHGVSMSIGSTDPLDFAYLDRLGQLADEIDPPWVSDHLCWSSVGGRHAHELLPLPFTPEVVTHVASRVATVQERLRRQVCLENISSYLHFEHSTMSEWEFLVEVARRSGCGILLDVNNIFVNAHNHSFAATEYLDHVPADLVVSLHLAGHRAVGSLLLDTHDQPISAPVWQLYAQTVARLGQRPTLIEWDDDLPALATLLEQAAQAERVEAEVLARGEA